MTPPPLRIGFVGAGFITRFHMQALVAVRDCVVAGIASKEGAEGAGALARELRLGEPKLHRDVAELAADPGVDAIWICTPNFTRIEVMDQIAEGCRRRAAPLRGLCCEKPLGRTLAEAERVASIAAGIGVPTGYLEDMVFAPHLQRGREVAWRRGAALAGRPFLARAAEEHGGPHSQWFWQGRLSGGGTALDMMCHSLEAARWLLTEPGQGRASLEPFAVEAVTANLKWARDPFVQELEARYGRLPELRERPCEDYARATVRWRAPGGEEVLSETTSSWAYTGAGLRHTFELLGPEYAMEADMSRTGLEVFFSRRVAGGEGEDLVEKQNAEQGLMPVAPDETALYGYQAENRHFVRAFLDASPTELSFADGVEVVRLLMAAYRAAEEGRTVDPRSEDLRDYVPAPAREGSRVPSR